MVKALHDMPVEDFVSVKGYVRTDGRLIRRPSCSHEEAGGREGDLGLSGRSKASSLANRPFGLSARVRARL